MRSVLAGKRIVLGVTGSIAAYKAAYLASALTQAGALVDVVMTESATKLIAPLTFQSLVQRPVHLDMFSLTSDVQITHVSLGVSADAIVVAPATANSIAKFAHGLADDLLSTTVLAARCPVVVAPAMDVDMYENPATQENVAKLRERGILVVEPEAGRLASGLTGRGRLADPDVIISRIRSVLARSGDLAGLSVLVTAGGTQEPIDPVRVITNRSSGKMGYAIAEAALDRGARVTLVSAPTALRPPGSAEFVPVLTAEEMRDSVMAKLPHVNVLIMAAAVADFRVDHRADQKVKRGEKSFQLSLVPNPDILAEAGAAPEGRAVLKVGFAAESEDLVARAREKLTRKRLDMIVANRVDAEGTVFGNDLNEVTIIDSSGSEIEVKRALKTEIAHQVLDHVARLARERGLKGTSPRMRR